MQKYVDYIVVSTICEVHLGKVSCVMYHGSCTPYQTSTLFNVGELIVSNYAAVYITH